MVPFWPWSQNTYPHAQPDPRLEPIDGDEIDELVNEQLARGMDNGRR